MMMFSRGAFGMAEALLSARRRNCAMRDVAAICCSGHAAHIFTIPQCLQ